MPGVWPAAKGVLFSLLVCIVVTIYGRVAGGGGGGGGGVCGALVCLWMVFLLDLELGFVGKLLVFRWGLVVLLLLRICFFFVVGEISWGLSRVEVGLTLLRLSVQTSECLNGLLNVDSVYFDQMVSRVCPAMLQLDGASSSDAGAPFLDLGLCVSNDAVSAGVCDKRDDFDFDMVGFPFLDGGVPRRA